MKRSKRLTASARSTDLTKYDPVRGVLSIHAAKEAEKRARRARDIGEVAQAVEKKLRAQADFIVWWDIEAARIQQGGDRKSTSRKREDDFLKPEDFGLTVKILSHWRTRLHPEAFDGTLADELDHARRRLEFDIGLAEERRRARLATERPLLPAGIFRVIYADPPWHYGNSGAISDADDWGRAASKYPTMTIAELCELDVKSRAADDAVLFLWVTSPLLAECWPVIDAWGFTYKASMVWDKVAHNFGNYVSVRHELLLICTRGSCLPDHPTPMPDSVMTIQRSGVHSEKPEEFRAVIDRLYDGGDDQKLELFGRQPAQGWTQFGNELTQAS